MTDLTRRMALASLAAVTALQPALAQQSAAPPLIPFRFDDVVRRARDLAAAPFDASLPPLPEPIANLDFDAYRDIRFRPDRALLASTGKPFRMQLFHLGFLYNRPITVNVIRDGVPTPVAYQPQLFDYGRTKIERPLPVNLGFAGFRLHYPLNNPRVLDELVAFLGASYFRFLGRGQQYGISARGLALNVDAREPEEFPFFREFWIDVPQAGSERVTIFALLDSPSVAGAYRFEVYPGSETVVDVGATLFPRRQLATIGLAPLTSMYFSGENERRIGDDFRPELHDSDGLLVALSSGEWVWRPIRNPAQKTVTGFGDTNPKGFGLMQRDRGFESYQDLEAAYQLRPSYWVEPNGNWGEGRVELVEIPTAAEVHDNVVAYWAPRQPYEAGQEVSFGYRIRAVGSGEDMHSGGKVANTFVAPARNSGSVDPSDRTARRFLIDFAGGNLPYYLPDPGLVEVVPSTSAGRILATFVVPNQHTGGFRAAIDVKLEAGQSTDLRAYLRSGGKALTETWTYRWSVE
ncbi:MAG: glucan biosynthesis protein [Enterovirga sp.]|nr:glucan biosynthesis protein [Enterovirga sp.]